MKTSICFGVLFGLQIIFSAARNAIISSEDDEWWRGGVFYQIYPRSFQDSDNDGIGDIQGIISRLEHLKDLGVTGTWLSPVFMSPMNDGGYDISDFKEINPLFGSNADMEELFAKAKELGLKIILDFVPNHTSDEHEWFKKSVRNESGYEDFYVWRNCPLEGDERKYPNNWISVFHNRAWSYNSYRDQCYLHQFVASQPDLNFRNSKVREEMEKVVLFWLEKGADGFRVDAINHCHETEGLPDEPYIDPNGDKMLYTNLLHVHTMDRDESYEEVFNWRKIMDEFAAEHGTPKKFLMTEAYASIKDRARWYGTVERPGSHMPFNFDLISNLNKDSTAEDFKAASDAWLRAVPEFVEPNWVLGNHDRPRIGYRYGENRHESLALMTMLMPGINVIYYGEEILMTDNRAITWVETDDPWACQSNETVYQQFTRDPVRTPFQWDNTKNAGFSNADKTWLPVHSNFETRNLQAQKAATKSTYKFYKHLIQLRKMEIFKKGSYRSKAINNQLFGYVRSLSGQNTVAVFINLGSDKVVNIGDLLESSEIPQNPTGKILAATNDSKFNTGEAIVSLENIELGNFDAIAIEIMEDTITTSTIGSTTLVTTTSTPQTTTLGSSALVSSLFLVVVTVSISILN